MKTQWQVNPAPKARFPTDPVKTPLLDSKSTAWEFFTGRLNDLVQLCPE